MDISGKAALVTGAASGIGRATCEALATKGASHIHLVDLNEEGCRETARLCGANVGTTVHPCNVADLGALEAVFAAAAEETGLDIVFNNAGMVTGADMFPDTPNARIELIVAVNVSAVFAGTNFAVKHMADRGGVVVNTGSTSSLHDRFIDILYSATKAAVLQFTQGCGKLMESHGVRVCAILPGLVDTPIVDTTGGDTRADWMQKILDDNVAMPPAALAAGVVALIEDDSNAGGHSIVADAAQVEAVSG